MSHTTPEHQHQSGEVAQRPIPTEVGRAATHDLQSRADMRWTPLEDGLQLRIPGFYLGKLVGEDGWGAGAIDRKKTPIPARGFGLEAVQAPTGHTELLAEALEGHTVEVADFDTETGTISWRGPDIIGHLRVDVDGGNLLQIPPAEWLTTNSGNPGVRAGVIRVTDPKQQVTYYAVGANFDGEADSWNVESVVVELAPQEAPSVTDPAHTQIPPA